LKKEIQNSLLEIKMKNRKWLTYTLGIVLILIALTVVGMAGFRAGMMQNGVPFARMHNNPAFAQHYDNNGPMMQGNNSNNNGNNNPHGNDFGNRHDNGRRGGISMLGGLFGLIHIAVLGLLVWFGYKYVQKSGWRFVKVSAATVETNQTPSEVVEEQKE